MLHGSVGITGEAPVVVVCMAVVSIGAVGMVGIAAVGMAGIAPEAVLTAASRVLPAVAGVHLHHPAGLAGGSTGFTPG